MRRKDFVLALLIILVLTSIIFRKFIFRSLLPIPSDIITGVYYPWLNHKWGTDTGVPVKNPLPSDIPSLVYPWRLQVRQQIYQGRFPLWNDQIFSGMPLFGNFQSSVLSLSNLIFLPIKDNALSWSFGVVAQPVLMFMAAYLFLRKIKLGWQSSVFGALVYCFSGFAVVWMEYNLHGWVLMWLPLLLLSIEYFSEGQKWGGTLLALSVAGSVFSGYPQLTLYSFTIVFLYSLFKLFIHQLNWNKILIIGLFALLGLGISAIQLLPGYETASLSIRNVDTVAISKETRFLPLSYLSNLFAPDFYGNPATGNYFGKGFYDNFASYVGVVTIILSLVSLISFKSKKALNIFSLLLIGTGILLSTDTFFGSTVANLNIFGIKSIAARAMILTITGLVILSASGMDIIIKSPKLIHLLSPVFLIVLSIFMYQEATNPISKRNIILPLAITVATFIVIFFATQFRKTRFLLPYFFIAILSFELIRFSDKYLSFTPRSYLFPETPIISLLTKQPDISISKVETSSVIPENMWVPYGLKSAVGYDATAPLKYSRLLGMVGNKDLDHTQGRVGKIDQINKVSDMLGIDYLLTFAKKNSVPDANGKILEELSTPKFTLIGEEGSVRLLKISDASKLIGVYTKSLGYRTDEEFVDIVNNPVYTPSNTALIKNGKTLNGIDTKLKLSLTNSLPGEVTLSTESTAESYVTFKENFYPGWTAVVDGQKTNLDQADYSFMGVFVGKGQHTVSFKYLPESFRLGALISLISLGIFFWKVKTTYKP